jgi:hypothetical protein
MASDYVNLTELASPVSIHDRVADCREVIARE